MASALISRRYLMLLLGVFLTLVSVATSVGAATDEKQPPSSQKVEAPAPVPETLRSPRATMATFLHAMNDIKRGKPQRISDALSALDLSEINLMIRKERGRDIAWMLLEVMDRTRMVDLDRIPDREQGKPYVFAKFREGAIRISRQADGRWLFDKETIANVESFLNEVSLKKRVVTSSGGDAYLPWHLRVRQRMPEELKRVTLSIEHWRWIGIFITILLGVVADKLISWLLRFGVRRWKRRTTRPEFRTISDEILRPLGLMIMAMIWWIGINLLGLPEQAMLILLVAVKFLAGISGVWAAYRLVDLITAYLTARARGTRNRYDDALVPLISRTLKLFVTVIGIVFVADNLNINISSLLAGLGLGGLAFALAAKDMIQNLFGSVTVLMDRTFSVGDWIKVGDVEGTVEEMGFRSTRIRTFYNSVITVPNSRFITAHVDNMGARRYRRLSCKLGLTYDTPPDKIEAFCEGVRELVRTHPYMRKDYFHIYFNAYAAASLDILVYVFWETPDWGTELRERHRFLLDILRLAKRLGVEFAFPTQTIYLKQDGEGSPGDLDEVPQDVAFDMGRSEARHVVESTTGLNVKPPPVRFS